MRTQRPLFRATWAAAGLAVLLTLSACGGSEEAEAPQELSETENNKADVTFATDMIQHHAQALSMVDLTMDRELEPEVQELAEDDPGGPEPRDRDHVRLAPAVGRGGAVDDA